MHRFKGIGVHSIIGASIIGCSFLLARPFPTMASSAQPSNGLPASGVIDLWDTSPEMSRMMSLPGWAELQEVIKEEKATLWRWLLAHHTSQCCQPRKQGGVVESSKEAGLDRVLGVCELALDSGTVFQARGQLDQLFEPDEGNLPVSGINPLVYCSTMESLPDLAKENACREIFTFLLAIAPQKVYVATASMRDIERVRSAAEAFLDGRGVPASGTWAECYFGNTRQTAKPEPKKLEVPKYAPTSDPEVQAERDEALINRVRAHWKDTQERIDIERLPHDLSVAFADYIPKGGLMFWLLRFSDIFDVRGPAPGTSQWTFSIIAKGGLPASGVANTVHQADPSLQQSLAQPSQPASSGAAASTTTYDVFGAGGPRQQAQAQPAQPASSGTAASTTTYDVVGAGGPWQQAQAQPQSPWQNASWQKDAWQGGWWSSTEPSTEPSPWASTASLPVSGGASAKQRRGPRPQWTQAKWQNSAGWQ